MDKARQTASTYGEGIKNLSTEEGRKAFMGNAASKGVEATGVGGTSGLLKYGMAAALPAMQQDDKSPEKPAEGNIVDYSYDPISGKYRRLRSTPASQYQRTMSAKNGGITSLLSFADGGAAYSQADLNAIDAAVAAANDGSKTQAQREAARDELLSKYSAEALAAAPSLQSLGYVAEDYLAAQAKLNPPTPEPDNSGFTAGPGVGPGPDNYTIPGGTKAEGYSRDYTPEERININKAFIRSQQDASYGVKGLMADMEKYGVSAKDIALSYGLDQTSVNQYLTRGGASLEFGGINTGMDTKELDKYIAWQNTQPNPYGTGTLGDLYKKQGISDTDPRRYAQAQEVVNSANNRKAVLTQAGVDASGVAPWTDPNWREKQAAAAKAEAERQARMLAEQGKNVVVGGGFVAGPGGTTPTTTPPTGGVSSLPITNTVLPAYAGTNSPTGGISGLQVLTPQGVMGGSERGGTVSNVSQIIPAYQQYWQNAPVGSTVDFAGGKLSRISGAQAVFTAKNGSTYSMGPSSDLNIIAAQNPAIGETWRSEFGMVPQNYMQGESARAYEFLRGNEPYSVNQQIKGISRPYGEMAMGLPGATFGSNALLNQQAINEATAKQKADPTNKGINIPAPQYGYGVTNPGTYNMETVFDPNTGRYVENNMYEKSADLLADAKAVAAIPSAPVAEPAQVAGGGLMALGGMTGQANLGDYSDGGRLLRGPGDGVSDSIPATIGGKRQARLADGEFVVPARIVSELGNGSTEAGARQLYAMMDRIQKNRSRSVGKGKVAVNSKSSKFLPA